MIRIENTGVYGFEAAIRGMRNPMNSWDKCDSFVKFCCKGAQDKPCNECYDPCCEGPIISGVGKNDLSLMKKLGEAGPDHGKFLRMITVTADITAPLYWYKEYDTYKVGTVANSCSTMHKIATKEFTLDDFSHEHLLNHAEIYNGYVSTAILGSIIGALNEFRELYLKTKNKVYWWQLIQLLPSSYNQRRTVMLNYAVLKNIYHARKGHKLDEWNQFCQWIEGLPYSELITDNVHEEL